MGWRVAEIAIDAAVDLRLVARLHEALRHRVVARAARRCSRSPARRLLSRFASSPQTYRMPRCGATGQGRRRLPGPAAMRLICAALASAVLVCADDRPLAQPTMRRAVASSTVVPDGRSSRPAGRTWCPGHLSPVGGRRAPAGGPGSSVELPATPAVGGRRHERLLAQAEETVLARRCRSARLRFTPQPSSSPEPARGRR